MATALARELVAACKADDPATSQGCRRRRGLFHHGPLGSPSIDFARAGSSVAAWFGARLVRERVDEGKSKNRSGRVVRVAGGRTRRPAGPKSLSATGRRSL